MRRVGSSSLQNNTNPEGLVIPKTKEELRNTLIALDKEKIGVVCTAIKLYQVLKNLLGK